MKHRILISGGRNYANSALIQQELEARAADTEVVIHGDARGADTLAAIIAKNLGIPVIAEPALWKEHGKAAGPIRNQKMLDDHHPTMLLAFPDPESRGTYDMVRRAKIYGIPVIVFTPEE